MSYVNATATPADRAKAAASVIAIHALVGFGVVTGLTVVGGLPEIRTIIEGRNVIEPPPPPPPPTDELVLPNVPVSPPMTAPQPPLDLNQPTDTYVAPPRFDDTPTVRFANPPADGPIVDIPPAPPPTPAITPRAAAPRNGPAGWITNNDYSNADLRRENEGTARYRLVIGSDGRVDACEITASTGHDSLDRATCRLITSRARFEAATDGTGARVVGTYSGTVSWQIPE